MIITVVLFDFVSSEKKESKEEAAVEKVEENPEGEFFFLIFML